MRTIRIVSMLNRSQQEATSAAAKVTRIYGSLVGNCVQDPFIQAALFLNRSLLSRLCG